MAAEVNEPMPTPNVTMAALAASLGHFDPRSEADVDRFYSVTFPTYSEDVRFRIFSWLTSATAAVSPEEIAAFARTVDPILQEEPAQEEEPDQRPAPFMW